MCAAFGQIQFLKRFSKRRYEPLRLKCVESFLNDSRKEMAGYIQNFIVSGSNRFLARLASAKYSMSFELGRITKN